VDGGGRIAKHLFVDGEVDGISDGNFAVLGLLLEAGDVSLDDGHLFGADGAGVDLVGEGRALAGVVVGVGGIGEFQVLGEFDRWHR